MLPGTEKEPKSLADYRADAKKIKEDKEALRLANSNVATQNYYEYKYKEQCLLYQQQLNEQQIQIISGKLLLTNRIQMQQAKLQLQKERGTQLVITNKNIRILELEQQIQEQLNELIQEKITLNKTIEELEKKQITPQTSPQAQVKFKEPLEEIREIKEQHTYTDMEKKINVQRYMRYGGKRYLQERQMQFQTTGAILPSLSSVKRYRREYLLDEDNYSANMGLEFDPTKFLSNVNTWKQTNHVPEQQDSEGNVKKIKAHIQMDAMYVNYQVCNINGVTVGTIKNHKNQEVPIKYIFAYILVCEENYPPLPIFCQYSWDGKARDAQYQCYLQICKALEKYNFQADKLCHDSDTFFSQLDEYALDVVLIIQRH
ncbi:Hypothetical_protein [Hexamita inflata]|uniref:Hypothetical_protein n=1 Tax=Hexamita inflata TaxID=28002 RepID=A0AA86UAM4_9EUKA|nr:Hypothetical protein HINF_LOCUS32821 [Hexamita inflata]